MAIYAVVGFAVPKSPTEGNLTFRDYFDANFLRPKLDARSSRNRILQKPSEFKGKREKIVVFFFAVGKFVSQK